MAISITTGTFQSAFAGKVTVTLRGQYRANTYADAGFPSSGNTAASNLSVRGYLGPSGSPTYTPIMEKYTGTVSFQIDYPGGNVVWNCGIEEVAHKDPSSGIWSYGWDNLALSMVLQKK